MGILPQSVYPHSFTVYGNAHEIGFFSPTLASSNSVVPCTNARGAVKKKNCQETAVASWQRLETTSCGRHRNSMQTNHKKKIKYNCCETRNDGSDPGFFHFELKPGEVLAELQQSVLLAFLCHFFVLLRTLYIIVERNLSRAI